MLNDFDNTLKELLIRRVPLDPNEVEVSFECPRREWSAKVLKPTVNLYLFDMRENVGLRNGGWAHEPGGNDKPGGLKRLPVYMDLSYFITTWARNVADEHHLLWRVMTTLMREPDIAGDVLQGVMKDVGPPAKTVTAQADGVLRNPGEFWGALDNDLKPAVTYTATLAVDLDMMREAPLVLTKIVEFGNLERRLEPRLIAVTGTVRTRPAKKGTAPQQPVAGARVMFPRLGINVESDDDGQFSVARIPEGTHRVKVETAAGAVAEREIEVPAGSYDLEV